jgi:hypothetical protein
MKKLECIVFDVEHGFSSFIKSPNDYGLLIDFGSRYNFSPIKWIRSNYTITSGSENINYFEGKRFAEAYLTHFHKDHFDDVGSFKNGDSPRRFMRDKKIINDMIENKIKAEKTTEGLAVFNDFKSFNSDYNVTSKTSIEWGFDFFDYEQLTIPDAKDISSTDDEFINNRSLIIAIKYAGIKILIPGDIMVEGWKKALEYPKIQNLISNTNFFIAAHHGHKSGFTTDILKYSGKPSLFIVSAKSGDESIDTSLSNPQNCKGYKIKGASTSSNMISTRSIGSIKIDIYENGLTSVYPIETCDNLTDEQRTKLNRRTKRVLKNYF